MTLCANRNNGCQEHFSCRMLSKGIQIAPSATPTATHNWVPTPSEPSSIRGAIQYDERPGGIKMPFLKSDGSVVRKADVFDGFDLGAKVRNQRQHLTEE